MLNVPGSASKPLGPLRGTSAWFDGQHAVLRKRKSRAIGKRPAEVASIKAKYTSDYEQLVRLYWVLTSHGLVEADLQNRRILDAQKARILGELTPEERLKVGSGVASSMVAEEFGDFIDNTAQEDDNPALAEHLMREAVGDMKKFFASAKTQISQAPPQDEDSEDEDDEDCSSLTSDDDEDCGSSEEDTSAI